MYLRKVDIRNFRLLANVTLELEQHATVIVGRNNSGKTSLTELFNRLLGNSTPTFRLEDFSLSTHKDFWAAHQLHQDSKSDEEIRNRLPAIEVDLTVAYAKGEPELGVLGECIIDLDPDCIQALIQIRYQLKDGAVPGFFSDIPAFDVETSELERKVLLCRALRGRITSQFRCAVHAVDPGDPTNVKPISWTTLRGILASGFINAQRGLDDDTIEDRAVIGTVVEALLKTAMSDSASDQDRAIAKQLDIAVQEMQTGLDGNFNQQLQQLIPAFSLFGYPGFADPQLQTETTLDVKRLLANHTTVHYTGLNGINLPESYNGLGARNLIFIMLKLLEFYKGFVAQPIEPTVQLVFIEEPEVHLHPQMQEVFIGQLTHIALAFANAIGNGRKWPVQFVVTTHSSHLANRAEFATMRYFLVKPDVEPAKLRYTVVKDLRAGLAGTPEKNIEFLHRYVTLTRCDLMFADKAVLIEGTSERLLLPKMIEELGKLNPNVPSLLTQYMSVVEVGGAYAHLFIPLVEFLELPTLIITDLDSVKLNADKRYGACIVSEGERTSNACIKAWFAAPNVTPEELISKSDSDKKRGNLRIAYEVPESAGAPCGRSFEDTFILANHTMFGLDAPDEAAAAEKSKEDGKSDFALKYAIEETTWNVPRYIADGLLWLAQLNRPPHEVEEATQPLLTLKVVTTQQETAANG